MTPKQLLKAQHYYVQDYFMACSTCLHKGYLPNDDICADSQPYCTKAKMGDLPQQLRAAAVHNDGICDLYTREG